MAPTRARRGKAKEEEEQEAMLEEEEQGNAKTKKTTQEESKKKTRRTKKMKEEEEEETGKGEEEEEEEEEGNGAAAAAAAAAAAEEEAVNEEDDGDPAASGDKKRKKDDEEETADDEKDAKRQEMENPEPYAAAAPQDEDEDGDAATAAAPATAEDDYAAAAAAAAAAATAAALVGAENAAALSHPAGGAASEPAAAMPEPAQFTMSLTPTGETVCVMDCPSGVIGKVIGRGGETINSLQNMTASRIQIDQSGGQGMRTRKITITGAQPNVQSAVERIQAFVMQGPSLASASAQPVSQPGDVSVTMECPAAIVGRLIGRQGETIRAMQSQSGASITIDQNFPEGVNRVVTITGQSQSIEAAQKLVADCISGASIIGPSSAGGAGGAGMNLPPGSAYRELDVRQEFVGRIIGRGGETVRKLQQMSGARIQIDQSVWKVAVTGSENAVNTACAWIESIMNGGNPFGGMGGGGGNMYQQRMPMMQQGYPGYGGGMDPYAQMQQQQQMYAQSQMGYAQQMQHMQQQQHQQQRMPPQQQQQQQQQAALPAGWTQALDGEGRTYYVHMQQGISQWERPFA